jgi:crotonyl-CoA carboxylase/reductase
LVKKSKSVELGKLPELGDVPENMIAQVIRAERFGEPSTAFQVESVQTPEARSGEVIIAVMAAGINYNNVWAARGIPVNVIDERKREGEPYDFHIGGSDASGIVYSIGPDVEGIEIGDRVVVHPGY